MDKDVFGNDRAVPEVYVAVEGFHFKVTEQFVINVYPDTKFVMDEDGWLHNVNNQEIRFSSPFNTLKHLITKVGTDGKLDPEDNGTEK